MKVVHLSTSSSGGSWVSAQKLSNAQQLVGIDSKTITLQDLERNRNRVANFCWAFVRRLNTLFSQLISRNPYEFLSIFSSSSGLLKILNDEKPDLVHIHNWFNLISLKDLKKIGEKFPIVFTMHDSRIATGGCHIPYECKNYKNNCNSCPAVKFKKNLISEAKDRTNISITSIGNYSILAPTNWMLSQAVESGVTRNSKRCLVIPNICPEEFELPTPRDVSKPIRLLFVAANLNSQTKGLGALREALKLVLESGVRIELHLIGDSETYQGETQNPEMEIITHGLMSNRDIKRIMEVSDLLIVPSTSENFPNVVLEAMSVGLVVLAASVGGIPEMITHRQNGYLYIGDSQLLAASLLSAINDSDHWPEIRRQAQLRMKEKYNNARTLEVTLEVYTETIKSFSEGANK